MCGLMTGKLKKNEKRERARNIAKKDKHENINKTKKDNINIKQNIREMI